MFHSVQMQKKDLLRISKLKKRLKEPIGFNENRRLSIKKHNKEKIL